MADICAQSDPDDWNYEKLGQIHLLYRLDCEINILKYCSAIKAALAPNVLLQMYEGSGKLCAVIETL